MMSMNGLRATVVAILLLPSIRLDAALAQGATFETRCVTLIEQASIPQGKRALVIRRASGSVGDVIALSSEATAADLGAAIRALDALYARFGESVQQDIAASVRSETKPPTQQSDRTNLDASFLQQLRRSQARDVAGFGRVKALEIKVPKRTPRS